VYAGVVRALVVINPIAGGARGRAAGATRVALAERVLRAAGVEVATALTSRAGHAKDLARQAVAEGYDVVFAWGGDGTINEVAGALAFTNTALAIVPAGSGNGLARALGLPADAASAFRHALAHGERRIDTGTMAGRFFVNLAGVGLDADVAWRYNRRVGGRRGSLPYVLFAIRSGLTYESLEYQITLDGHATLERALLIAVANSAEYGNGAIVAPGAVPDDGRLDVVVVRDRRLVGRLAGAWRLLNGSLLRDPGVLRRCARHVAIETDPPLRFHVDGEPAESADRRLVAVVDPGALKIRA
jgi:diacylglycerol kinase (ATP)